MNKYFYTILSLVLVILLFVPFMLKLKDSRLEIYPAVIFPSGAGLVNNEEQLIIIHHFDFYGYKDDLVLIDKNRFFGDIPIWYSYAILEGKFGLEKYINEFKLYKPPIKFQIRNNFTAASVQETKKWIREQLREQNFKDSLLIVKNYRLKYNLETQTLHSKEVVNEQIFKLY